VEHHHLVGKPYPRRKEKSITGDDESEAIQHADPRFLGEIAGLRLCTARVNDAIFWER
jgi:hypothetical protein